MAKKRESRLQRKIRQALEQEIGGVWTKIHGGQFQEPGIGDLVGCVEGLHIEVEVKTDNGELRDTQRLRRWRIKHVGKGAYLTARSPEQAVRRVAEYIRSHGKAPQNSTAGIPGKSGVLMLGKKNRRVVHATAHGQDPYHVPISRAPVEAKRIRQGDG